MRLHDPDDAGVAAGSSVYRFLVRSRPQPFMTALDCADPSMQVDRRNEIRSPARRLAAPCNNGFMLVDPRSTWPTRVRSRQQATRQSSDSRLPAGGRSDNPLRPDTEREPLARYAKEYGLANACRVILNLNEFSCSWINHQRGREFKDPPATDDADYVNAATPKLR